MNKVQCRFTNWTWTWPVPCHAVPWWWWWWWWCATCGATSIPPIRLPPTDSIHQSSMMASKCRLTVLEICTTFICIQSEEWVLPWGRSSCAFGPGDLISIRGWAPLLSSQLVVGSVVCSVCGYGPAAAFGKCVVPEYFPKLNKHKSNILQFLSLPREHSGYL